MRSPARRVARMCRQTVHQICDDLDGSWPGTSTARRWALVLLEPGVQATVLLRLQLLAARTGRPAISRVIRRLNFSWNGIDVVPGATVGARVLIRHPAGIVLGHRVRIGDGVTIAQGVTLGQRHIGPGADADNPVVEAGAVLGAGCTVLGPVTVGRSATVGAHSVVLEDVATSAVVVGAPAQPVGVRHD